MLPIEHSSRNAIIQSFVERTDIYIYIYIYIRIFLNKISFVIFLNYGKANLKEHLSETVSEGFNCLYFRHLLTM